MQQQRIRHICKINAEYTQRHIQRIQIYHYSPFLATKYANKLQEFNITMYTPHLKDVQQETENSTPYKNISLCLLMQANSQFAPQLFKLFSIYDLGENVCQLLLCVNMLKCHNFLFNKISNEVMSNVNVLCLAMSNRILGNIDSTQIVIVQCQIIFSTLFSFNICFIQTNCEQLLPVAIYSASAVDRDTQLCFLLN